MARNMAGVYSLPAGSTVANGDVSDATDLNTPLADIEADLNVARPIVAGGTGATSASTARTNLDVPGRSAAESISGTWQFGTFSDTGATNGQRISGTVFDSSRDTTSAATHQRFYNPNGVIGTLLSSGSDFIVRATAGSVIWQTGGANTRMTLSDAALTLASGVVFTGNGSGLTNLDASDVTGDGSGITTLLTAAVTAAMAGANTGAIGTFAMLRYAGGSVIAAGDNVLGSNLNYSDAAGTTGSTSPSGTWKCMGRASTGSDTTRTTMWMRIS